MELVDRKTACLFSVCSKLGALASGADSQSEERLGDYAWNLGMAFQLVDDCSTSRNGADGNHPARPQLRSRAVPADPGHDRARGIIGEFPDSPYQRALYSVTELVTERGH
jgi:octaprenyl-diphosphate synthase